MSTTKIALPLLQRIEVASPCSANWAEMQGDDIKRFCSQCHLNVFDLSAMSQDDAEEFLQNSLESQGRTCVRLFRRSDGRVLTRDCPVGLRRIRMQVVKSAATVLAFLFGGIAMAAGGTRLGKWAEQRQNVIAILGKNTFGSYVAGEMCIRPMPIPIAPAGLTPAGLTPAGGSPDGAEAPSAELE